MARWYTRAESRAYKEKRQEQAARVAARLMGRKRYQDFFSGTEMKMPIQYDSRTATAVNRMKEMAMKYPSGIVWAQEPGEAARKRREEEERRDSIR